MIFLIPIMERKHFSLVINYNNGKSNVKYVYLSDSECPYSVFLFTDDYLLQQPHWRHINLICLIYFETSWGSVLWMFCVCALKTILQDGFRHFRSCVVSSSVPNYSWQQLASLSMLSSVSLSVMRILNKMPFHFRRLLMGFVRRAWTHRNKGLITATL